MGSGLAAHAGELLPIERAPRLPEFTQRAAGGWLNSPPLAVGDLAGSVVLLDVCMPQIDGFELASMIREHPRCQKTSIIFVSATQMTDLDRLRGFQAGAVDYVSVPVDPSILRARVAVFADLYRKARELERLNAELERRVALGDVDGRTGDPAALRSFERPDHGLERTRQVVVVRVQIGDDLAARPLDPLVDRIRLTLVGLGDPPGEPILVASDHVDGLVGRSAVDDHVLEVRIALIQHRANRPLDEMPLV